MSKKQKGWIIAGAALVVVIALVLLIASIRSQNTNSSGSTAYQTTTVQLGTLTSSVDGSGTVASPQSASLAWQTAGQIGEVRVKVGSQVKAGDVLATQVQDPKTQSTLEASLVTAQENLAQLIS